MESILKIRPQPKVIAVRLKGKPYKDLQKRVLERDDFTCRDCGHYTQAPPHHIKFRSQGGSDVAENLTTLCIKCHDILHNR